MNRKIEKPNSRQLDRHLNEMRFHLDQYEQRLGNQDAAFHLHNAGISLSRARRTAGECDVCKSTIEPYAACLSTLERIQGYITNIRF